MKNEKQNKKSKPKSNSSSIESKNQNEITDLEYIESCRKELEEIFGMKVVDLDRFIDLIPESIVFTDLEAKIFMVNSRSVLINGYDRKDELIGKNGYELIMPEDLDIAGKVVDELLDTGYVKDIEYHLIKKDGTIYLANFSASIIKDKKGKSKAILAISKDLTERIQIEDALKTSEEKWRSLVQHAPDIIITVDRDGIIQFINRTVSGLTPAKVVGTDLFGYIEPEYIEVMKKHLNKVFQTGKPLTYELAGQGPDRTKAWYLSRIGPITRDNKVIGATIITNDITDRKNMENELEKHQVELEKLVDERTKELIKINEELKKEDLERKKALDQLKKSEETLRFLFNNIHDVVYTFDSELILKNISPSVEKMSGYKPDELLGRKFEDMDFLAPESLALAFEAIEKIFDGEDLGLLEFYFNSKDGTIRTAEVSVVPIFENGNFVELISVARDLTERKQIEAALRESEEKYRGLLDNISDGIYTLDKNGYFTYVNPVIEKRSGMTIEEFKEIKFQDIVHPDDLDNVQRNFERIMKGESVSPYELRYRTRDGGILYVEINTRPIYKNKEVIGLHGISRDITNRKQTESALRESEEKYRTFVENFHGIAYRAKDDWVPEFFHGAVEKITGYTEKELKAGKPSWDKIIHPDDFPTILNDSEEKLHSTPEYSFEREYRIVRKDEEIRWIHEYIKSVSIEPFRLEGALYDITERKIAEEQIRRSLDEKEVFMREIHHRVKNNIQVITSMLNLYSAHFEDTKQIEALKEIQNRIKSMALIHEKLYQSEDLSIVDFNEYINDLVISLFRFYGININEIKPKITVENISLGLDAGIPCGLIINELVSNSMKHAFKKGDTGEIKIEFKQKRDDNTIILDISDNGIGFPEELDFHKTNTFGLQLVIALVEQLGGTIELNTDKGTNFIIIFNEEKMKTEV